MRRPVDSGSPVVVKVGSSSLTKSDGGLDDGAMKSVVDHVVSLVKAGHPPVLVTSAAIAAGFPALGMRERPSAIADLQVAAAVGQTKLMESYARLFAAEQVEVGQVLLTRDVLGNRSQYLNARNALTRMLEIGVVPIVNENDTVVIDEVKLGDNDRLAAIASHLVNAGMLVILTDTTGLFTNDPRLTDRAELLGAVAHSDEILDRIRSNDNRGAFGSGGVTTKVVAARMAAFSGIPTVIASAVERDVVSKAVLGEAVGTWIDPRPTALSARKLWIAFGLPSRGSVTVDEGASDALLAGGRSLLGVGVTDVSGVFDRGDAVEIIAPGGQRCAKGIVRMSADELRRGVGAENDEASPEVVHRDDMVVFT